MPLDKWRPVPCALERVVGPALVASGELDSEAAQGPVKEIAVRHRQPPVVPFEQQELELCVRALVAVVEQRWAPLALDQLPDPLERPEMSRRPASVEPFAAY